MFNWFFALEKLEEKTSTKLNFLSLFYWQAESLSLYCIAVPKKTDDWDIQKIGHWGNAKEKDLVSRERSEITDKTEKVKVIRYVIFKGNIWSTVRLRFRKSIVGHYFLNTRKLANNDFQYHRDIIYSV